MLILLLQFLRKKYKNLSSTLRYCYNPTGKDYRTATEFIVDCNTGDANAVFALSKDLDFGTAKFTVNTVGYVNLSLKRKLPNTAITVGCNLNTITNQFTPGLHVEVDI